MNDLEVSKDAAKLNSTELDFSMTPEDSQSVYLKKREEAETSAKLLGEVTLTEGAGQQTADTVDAVQETSAKQHKKSFTTDGRESEKSAAKSEDVPWYERQWQARYSLAERELILRSEVQYRLGNSALLNAFLPQIEFSYSNTLKKNQ